MFTGDNMREFDFPWPNKEKGYQLFPLELENDPLVLFHGTLKKNLNPILKEGFKPCPTKTSVSYAKSSIFSLTHIFTNKQTLTEEYVVIAVRFDTIELQGIKNNLSDIHVYKLEIQPTIIGYCTVPINYEHK